MTFVQAKCTACGANLQVEATKDAAICEACNSAFIVEKAVNHYNTVNNTTNNIKADVVNVYGGNSTDFVIRAGVLKKYIGAATEVVIPDSVIIIGESAFEDCSRLVRVTIPDGVIEIDDMAFAYCTGLTSVEIPDSVTAIKADAFAGCTGLKEVVVPSSVIEIADGAFRDCIELNINISGDVSIISKPFEGINSVTVTMGVRIINRWRGGKDAYGKDSYTDYPMLVPGISNLQQLQTAPYAEVNVFKEIYLHLGCPKVFNGVTWQQAQEVWELKKPKEKSGCYIATAVYGSYEVPEVLVLRRFRDDVLGASWIGRMFIRSYYHLSPPVAEKLKNAKRLNCFVRKALDKLVAWLSH